MNRRDALKVIGAGSVALATPGCVKTILKAELIDGRYDYDEFLLENWEEMLDGVYFVQNKADGAGGTGFATNGKIITANHLIGDNAGEYLADDKPCKVIHTDIEADLAVLEPSFKVGTKKWGDSDKLSLGNRIYVAGCTHLVPRRLKAGRVSGTRMDARFWKYARLIQRPESSYFTVDSFCIDSGDSGGPDYALMDGRPEVVGMTKMRDRELGICHKSNDIRKRLKKYV